MTDQQTGAPDSWRVISAIYVKDIIDAVRNWATLAVVVGTAMVLLTAQAGSLLANLVDQQIVFAYAPVRSLLLREMRRIENPSMVPVDSFEDLQIAVADAPDVRVGVSIPATAEEKLEMGESVPLDVFYAHWADMDEVNALAETLELRLKQQFTNQIELKVQPEGLYPLADGGGRSLMVTSALVIGVLSIGTFLTPYLLAEEREEGTLNVLLLSPASAGQIVFAKALVGLTYCLIVGCVGLVFNWHFVVHPWLAFISILLLGFFSVCLGLYIGLLARQISTVNLWMAVSLLILIVPTILLFADTTGIPDWVDLLLGWIPTVASGRLLRLSFLESIQMSILLQPLAALGVFTAASFAAVIFKLHQQDRE
jgi:ABC-type Na+ efflux pump permease subunit